MMLWDVYSPDSLIRCPDKDGVWDTQFADSWRVREPSAANCPLPHSAVRASGGEKTNVDVDFRCRYTSTLTTLHTHYNNTTTATAQQELERELSERACGPSYSRECLKRSPSRAGGAS